MNRFRTFSGRPSGQVLLATILFCFIFSVLFIGLYKAGMTYSLKERSRRSTDLTVLSAGAIYANGLQLVRYSNVMLMLFFAADIARMGLAIAPFIPGFPETIPAAVLAAKKADPHLREQVQRIQSRLFGISLPRGEGSPETRITGIYPLLIEWEGHQVAGGNLLEESLLSPRFSYNLAGTRSIPNSLKPDMALRFRTADELLPPDPSVLYSLSHNGQRFYFSESQVEPAENPRSPGQMRVRRDAPSLFAGMWVKREKEGTKESGSNPLSRYTGIGPSIWRHLKGLLSEMTLDVTHREDPPHHTLTLLGRQTGQIGKDSLTMTHLSEVVLEGGGLAAWNVADPPFAVYLQKPTLPLAATFREFFSRIRRLT